MQQELINKKKKLAVLGLGYVGLPIALEFARNIQVIGFDINEDRLQKMKEGIDPSGELDTAAFNGCDIEFTSSIEKLKEANFFIVTVPTPIDEHNLPDLKPILGATKFIGQALKKGDYVVYESTVYPGCTEEDCIPILEELSGLKFKQILKSAIPLSESIREIKNILFLKFSKLFPVVMLNLSKKLRRRMR